MRILSLVFAVLLAVQDRGARCEHRPRGAARPVDPARMEREYAEFARIAVRWTGTLDARVALDGPYDSGLPACRTRRTRRVSRSVPEAAVGRSVRFAPDGDFVTRAPRRRDLLGRLLATRESAAAFGVECVPSRVSIARTELIVEENP